MRHILTATTALGLLIAAPAAAIAQTATTETSAKTKTTTENAGMENRNWMDQSAIENRLEDRGFESIDVEFDGKNYAGTADWYGEEVDLTVTASTGRVIEPDQLSSDQISTKLEDDGYEDVSDVREAGDEFTATASRFGEEMELRVDASTGNIVDPRELKKDQIETLLDDEGYSEVVIYERDGEYGNFYASGQKDDEVLLLEVNPLSGRIVNERAES